MCCVPDKGSSSDTSSDAGLVEVNVGRHQLHKFWQVCHNYMCTDSEEQIIEEENSITTFSRNNPVKIFHSRNLARVQRSAN